MLKLSNNGRIYVVGVTATGLILIAYCLSELLTNPIDSGWLILAGLTLLTGSFTIRVPALAARISVSETFVYTSVLLFGTSAGSITVALDALVASLSDRERPRRPLRALFNLSAGVISIWIASEVFYRIAGLPTFTHRPFDLPTLVGPLTLLAFLYFGVNSILIALALSFEKSQSAVGIWRNSFLWLSVSYFGAASIAALLVSYTRTVNLTALGIIVPILVITYLTFKTSLGRIEDATRHVDEVNRLYLSTIETLATAIDAKDQVTHGHIRRVQKFALALAGELGIRDERQVKAIEAAALLHDTGKLVVPEHILNKPGRLTPGEFDKMKLHASAGAEILSAIHFPYPVVPIVRHHHENWDGTGYPDGLRGTDIPIGARILQVVDCFDALTSDRPYRTKLSDEEALLILLQRRGTMYDPLVVDTFAAVKDRLEAAYVDTRSKVESVLETRAAEVDSTATHQLINNVCARNPSLLRDANAVMRSMLESTSASLAIFFLSNPRRDDLVAIVAIGRDGFAAVRTAMPIGSRVSGWVAANGRAIINADASLDLLREQGTARLSRCLAVPLMQGVNILGVASLYLDDPRGFSEHDLLLVEAGVASLDIQPLIALAEILLEGPDRPGAPPDTPPPTVH
jgi:putative nucleotidyltransferase with HDIG domain